MGISVEVAVTPALSEEAAAVALSSSTSADKALHQTIVIIVVADSVWFLLVGLRDCLPFIHLSCTDGSGGTTALQLLY
jgi:hypothetical protein